MCGYIQYSWVYECNHQGVQVLDRAEPPYHVKTHCSDSDTHWAVYNFDQQN